MNETTPQPLPDHPKELPLAEKVGKDKPARLRSLFLAMGVVVTAFDLCFWGVNSMGFSLALFCLILGAVILISRESFRWTTSALLTSALLAGAALAGAIETGVTNIFALMILIVVLGGESHFSDIGSHWGRWFSQALAVLAAPGRVFWLGARLLEATFSKGLGWTGGVIGGCLLTLPALFLALIFGSLLASGNAVFGSWTSSFFDWFWKELALYLDPARIILWLFVAFLTLPLLRPANIPARRWEWAQELPQFPEILPERAEFFCSILILAVLNLLFLVANTADALFLWSGRVMPSGVDYKSYVHEGVDSLIVTVILTAIVLTAIFQQRVSVARRPALKALALVWIAQNLFLLLSVALRLKYYIEAFEMSVARLGVIIFLVLVAVGFVLLTIKIVKEKSLSWLVGGCVLAVFVTFYITQFLNLAGWSANYNESRWEKDRSHTLDLWHMYQYGPAAWPAMAKANEIDPTIAIFNNDPNIGFMTTGSATLAQFDSKHWREFSLRAWWNRGALEEKPNK